MKKPPEPTQLLYGITHRQMLEMMSDSGIFCSVDRFRRILQDAQQRALSHQALERMAQNAEELGLTYDTEVSK